MCALLAFLMFHFDYYTMEYCDLFLLAQHGTDTHIPFMFPPAVPHLSSILTISFTFNDQHSLQYGQYGSQRPRPALLLFGACSAGPESD